MELNRAASGLSICLIICCVIVGSGVEVARVDSRSSAVTFARNIEWRRLWGSVFRFTLPSSI